MRRKKFRPAGAEFEGKCRQVERVAEESRIEFRDIRLSEFIYYNGSQWTVRSVIERREGDQWVEFDWSPTTHTISIDRPAKSATDSGRQ